jgi:hypothetical protein
MTPIQKDSPAAWSFHETGRFVIKSRSSFDKYIEKEII